jgi:hypothetical protein
MNPQKNVNGTINSDNNSVHIANGQNINNN